MKKLLIILAFMLMVTGCSNESSIPDGFHSYKKGEVESAVDQLDFTPELPQFVPILAEIVVTDRFIDIQTDKEAFDITMFTTSNDIFTIQMFNTEKTEAAEINEEVVLDDKTNAYFRDQPYSKTLTWEKNGITYKLQYRSGEHTLSKVDLIKVAESFQPS
ncbi:hypothetical protein SAMN04487944_12426 [Gracilibacillus ureilyticus]|uniref:Uncharacterized protein n=1 Tax=Gracilibacillus ureilyticus TaxID=531814 RepID=A0A1H9VJP1_9BACI|nr:DUF4367 domain-containing protein [Gracilibacillus ureilyticus]SES21738.1 hypothetical protein SAMN04487944_12426 [Gracilibacillus ureilyticus]